MTCLDIDVPGSAVVQQSNGRPLEMVGMLTDMSSRLTRLSKPCGKLCVLCILSIPGVNETNYRAIMENVP